ncbi:MAG: twitching motility protein [Microgenomates group bacterium GW2011_GWA1_48_10]|nr:MAG: twitching motility protein [Microgenomates group bacterium GW2011_GWA1_48_10]
MHIQDLLDQTIKKGASDLHLIAPYPAMLRIDGELVEIDKVGLNGEAIEKLVTPLLSEEQKKLLGANRELDFSYGYGEGRFRINVYYQKDSMAAAFRLIPLKIRGIDELNLPTICHSFAKLRQGFILVTGPTGHGKSTSIASMIEEINLQAGGHILTIEDPIEYLYSTGKAVVSQREMGGDTFSWPNALRAALREDPNVVLVGEMRDYETIAAAMTIAETGHLVFATLHTNSAAQTIDRIVDVFPDNQQAQIALQLSNTLEAVISQRLLPAVGGGRVPAVELLIATPAVRSIIRDRKSHLLDNVIQTSSDMGMMTMDMSLGGLVGKGKLNFDVAASYANNPEYLRELVKKQR